MKVKGLVVVFLVCLLQVAYVSADSPPVLPEQYWGYAYVNGVPASQGVSVTVKASRTGDLVGVGSVLENGLYSITVVVKDAENYGSEGVLKGESLAWYVDGVEVSSPVAGSDTAESGKQNSNFNLYVGEVVVTTSTIVVSAPSASADSSTSMQTTSNPPAEIVAETTSSMPSDSVSSSSTVPGILANLFSSKSKEESDEPLVASCIDGVRNNGEVGIDCGGPCPSCEGDEQGDNTNLWIIVGGAFVIIMFLVFSLFLLILVYYLAVKKKR
ncbi:MAG: hypothetical protein ABH834_02395 [Candidatus Altiarchaeota archaeon]